MNVNNFFKELFEDRLSYHVLGLEYAYPALIDLVKRNTLRTFSLYIFSRYKYRFNIDQNILEEDFSMRGIEIDITDSFLNNFNIDIFAVETCDPYDNYDDSGMYGSYGGAAVSGYSLDQILLANENIYADNLRRHSLGLMNICELSSRRTLLVENPATEDLVATFLIKFPTIASIPDDYYEYFMELAIYDIKAKMWNELKYMENIPVPGGNFDLKLDGYDSAVSDRENFLREFREKTSTDRYGRKFFTLI